MKRIYLLIFSLLVLILGVFFPFSNVSAQTVEDTDCVSNPGGPPPVYGEARINNFPGQYFIDVWADGGVSGSNMGSGNYTQCIFGDFTVCNSTLWNTWADGWWEYGDSSLNPPPPNSYRAELDIVTFGTVVNACGTIHGTLNTVVPPPPPGIDLTVTSFSVPNGTPGETVNASVTIANNGSAGTGSGFSVAINRNNSNPGCNPSGPGVFSVSTNALAAGGTRPLSIPVTLPSTEQNYTAGVRVDSGCTISESDESNNTSSASYVVSSSPPPPTPPGPPGPPPPPGSVSGSVLDQFGFPVLGAQVEFCESVSGVAPVLTNASGNFSASGFTNGGGYCVRIPTLPAGYSLPRTATNALATCSSQNSYESQRFNLDCSSTSGCSASQISCDRPSDANANFRMTALVNYNLNVSRTGVGDVTSAPAGINCGSDCSESYSSGTNVVLTASPGAGYAVGSWSRGSCSGNTCSVPMNQNRNITVNFVPVAMSCYDDASIWAGGTTLPSTHTMSVGDTLTFDVFVTNEGDTDWHHGQVYQFIEQAANAGLDLRMVGPTSPGCAAGQDYGYICNVIEPTFGQQWTFELTALAPSGGTPYDFDMQMIHRAGVLGFYMDAVTNTQCAPPPASDTFFGSILSSDITVVAAPIPNVEVCEASENPNSAACLGSYTVPELTTRQFYTWVDHDGSGPLGFINETASGLTSWLTCGGSGSCGISITSGGLLTANTDGTWSLGASLSTGESDTVNIVVPNAPLPEVDLRCNGVSGSPCSVDFGDTALITWCGSGAGICANTNPGSCTVTGPGGPWNTRSGSVNHTVFGNARFTLSCTGPGGSNSNFIDVVLTSVPQCSDGIDNDGNGLCDTASGTCTDGSIPGDPGCTDIFDDDESSPQCSDRRDNDGDGRCDLSTGTCIDGSIPGDPGCSNSSDNNETDPIFNEF